MLLLLILWSNCGVCRVWRMMNNLKLDWHRSEAKQHGGLQAGKCRRHLWDRGRSGKVLIHQLVYLNALIRYFYFYRCCVSSVCQLIGLAIKPSLCRCNAYFIKDERFSQSVKTNTIWVAMAKLLSAHVCLLQGNDGCVKSVVQRYRAVSSMSCRLCSPEAPSPLLWRTDRLFAS